MGGIFTDSKKIPIHTKARVRAKLVKRECFRLRVSFFITVYSKVNDKKSEQNFCVLNLTALT